MDLLIVLCRVYGGVTQQHRTRFIGIVGRNYANQSMREAWGFRTSTLLTWRYYPNKVAGFLVTQVVWWPKILKLYISPMSPSWRQDSNLELHFHGEALCAAVRFWRQAQGTRYKVGDRADIDVLNDKWILTPYSFKPFTRPPEGRNDMLVCELINSEERSWNVPLLGELFDEVEVARITSIPITRVPVRDTWVWHYDVKGQYSIKSGYSLWQSHPTHHTVVSTSSATSSSGALGEFWKELWRLKVPGKMKLFAWKLVQGYIPTKTTLAARHIAVEDLDCILCNSSPKTPNHIFRFCSTVRCFWDCVGVRIIEQDMGMREWCVDMMGRLEGDMGELFIASLWAIWTFRNHTMWNGHSFDPFYLALWLIQHLENIKKTWKQPVRVEQRGKTIWVCPPSGRLKINVDGAFNKDENMGGVVVVVRDDKGVGIAAEAHQIKYDGSDLNVELEACRWGLRLGVNQG